MSKGRYAEYDDRALWEHVADKINTVEKKQDEQAGIILRHDSQLAHLVPKLDLMLRPQPLPFSIRAAVVVIAASLFIIACAAVARPIVPPLPVQVTTR